MPSPGEIRRKRTLPTALSMSKVQGHVQSLQYLSRQLALDEGRDNDIVRVD
jgi:hypothetical protein